MALIRFPRRPAVLACQLVAAAVAASAFFTQPASALNGSCLFQVNGNLNLAFGVLNPSTASNVVQSVTVGTLNADQVGSCRTAPAIMTITPSNGANFLAGSRRLRNGTDFIPYSLSSPPTAPWTGATAGPWSRSRPGNNNYVLLPAMSGTILGTDYADAAAGAYTDTILLTVTP